MARKLSSKDAEKLRRRSAARAKQSLSLEELVAQFEQDWLEDEYERLEELPDE